MFIKKPAVGLVIFYHKEIGYPNLGKRRRWFWQKSNIKISKLRDSYCEYLPLSVNRHIDKLKYAHPTTETRLQSHLGT